MVRTGNTTGDPRYVYACRLEALRIAAKYGDGLRDADAFVARMTGILFLRNMHTYRAMRAREKEWERNSRPLCPVCENTGWVFDDYDKVVRCAH